MRPEELIEISEESSTVAFHRFVLLCNEERKNDLFCFFEGRDSQYYSSRIRSITNRKCQPISCGNKKNVLKVYDSLKNKLIYQKYSQAYFVDKDFDPILANDDIYETPCYSVENFYVNEECLSEILKNEFALTESEKEFEQIMNLFNVDLTRYNQSTILFNAWYAALKQKKHNESLKSTEVSLEDKLPKGFVCIKIGSVKSNYDLNKIKSYFPNAIDVTEKEVLTKQAELDNGYTSDKLRGKFQLTFFCEFLRFLIDDANKSKKILSKRTKFNFDKANIYTQLSQYARTTDCLIKYLKKYAA